MDIENLVTMANDIATFFESELGKDEAHKGVHLHLSRFWDPRMRRAIIRHVKESGGTDLLPSAAVAVRELPPA